MSAQTNEAAARRALDAFNTGDVEALDEVCSPDYVDYDPNDPGGVARGIEAGKEKVQRYRTAMSDLSVTIEELIATDDAVITRWRAKGTNDGELMGMPATGKVVEITGTSIDHFDSDGRIAESYDQWDNAGFMQQLGVSPEVAAQAG
jgi:steroid delta-isomerase-like uncharacterized protein